jgi:hypothetical protein
VQLPNFTAAVVPDRKISGYLLSLDHPAGAAKAKFFYGLGFTREQPERLRQALLQHASLEVSSVQSTLFGVKYVIEGSIVSPSGRSATIRSIWIVDAGDHVPRFATAYPVQGSRK